MRVTAKFRASLRRIIPAISLAVLSSASTLATTGCKVTKTEVVKGGENKPRGSEIKAPIRQDESILDAWIGSSLEERHNWVFSKDPATRGVLDLERNTIGWFDKNGNLAWAPGYTEADSLMRSGRVEARGILAKRYKGVSAKRRQELMEEFTRVAGCLQPAACSALVSLIRGDLRDPAAGPEPIEYESAEEVLPPSRRP